MRRGIAILLTGAALVAGLTVPADAGKRVRYDTSNSVTCWALYPHTCGVVGSKVSTGGLVPELAAKVHEIVHACGSTVISAVRNTRVAGTRRWSLHVSGNAVDLRGNPRCIFAHLRDWQGRYSTDYATVLCNGKPCPHVHIDTSKGSRKTFTHRRSRQVTRQTRR